MPYRVFDIFHVKQSYNSPHKIFKVVKNSIFPFIPVLVPSP